MSRRNIPQEMVLALVEVFERMGGPDGLYDWAMRNPDKFYLFLYPKLLPKVIEVGTKEQEARALPTVMVVDPQAALVALERLTDDSYAAAASRGAGDEGEVEGQQPAHALCVQEVDGGAARAEEAACPPDATETRQDDELGDGAAFCLPDYLPTP